MPNMGNGHTDSNRPLTQEERRARRRQRKEERRLEVFGTDIYRNGNSNTESKGNISGYNRKHNNAESKIKLEKLKQVKAKWYLKGGVSINKQQIKGGMFYAGSDTSSMIEPGIEEPSLICPVYKIAKTSEGASEFPPFPCYQYLEPNQRKKYLDFLASNRKNTDDIGCVFLYLHGIERRLIIDTIKDNEVTIEERAKLAKEVARLLRTFGDRSESLSRYLRMLLLYDGTIFKIYKKDILRDLLLVQSDVKKWSDNTDALEYMIISRFVEYGIDVPFDRIVDYVRARLIRTRMAQSQIEIDNLYDESIVKLARQRIAHSGFEMRLSVNAAPNVHVDSKPIYYPSSVSLRRMEIPLSKSALPDVEKMGIDFKALADIFLSAYYDVNKAKSILSMDSLKGISDITVDTLTVLKQNELSDLLNILEPGKRIVHIKASDLTSRVAKVFDVDIRKTQKNTLSLQSETMITRACACLGWQAIFPSNIDGWISGILKITDDNDVVLINRGHAYIRGLGRKTLAPIFGTDKNAFMITIPEEWSEYVASGIVYSWFLQEIGTLADEDDIMKISPKVYPHFTKRNKAQQVTLFFGILYAIYYANISSHSLRMACEQTKISMVQSAVFGICMEKFGYTMPTEAFDAVKKIYSKYPNADDTMLLYDYHAGDYRISYDDEENAVFSIDSDKLRETIKETSNVHNILTNAFKDDAHGVDTIFEDDEALNDISIGNEFITMLSDEDDFVDATADDGILNRNEPDIHKSSIEHPIDMRNKQSNNSKGKKTENDPDNEKFKAIFKAVQDAFGDNDEMQFKNLYSIFKENGAKTTADAMHMIAQINETIGNGNELIEVDGNDVYLNA